MKKHLPLDSQTSHSAKGKLRSSTDYSIVPGQEFLTLGRNETRKNEIIIRLIPYTEGTPWLIMRMNQTQESNIIPLLAAKYPLLYHPNILGYFFMQADAQELLSLIYESGLELYMLLRRDTAGLNTDSTVIPETIKHDFTIRFMKILADPLARFSIAPQPLDYYAKGNKLLVCVKGPLEGMRGYIVRTHRTRRLIFKISDTVTGSTESIHDSLFIPAEVYDDEEYNPHH